MTIAKDFVAKASVALVAAAMIFTMFAPSAKAQSSEDLQKMINDLLAQIAALQSQVGQGSSSAAGVCPYTWTRDLSQGATGADVMKLQQFLNANADTRVAATGAGSVGMETEYYGPATAAAVSKFQVMYRAEVLVGLVNPTGYFGPASRAKANALCVAAPVVVPPTDGGNGTSTDGGDSATLEGGAGSITVTDTTSDVEDDVNTGSSENVLGFKVEAEGSDVSVTNVKVTMDAGSGAGSNRLERYFDSFDVVLDGEVVGSMDAADFNRDSSGKYSSNVALKNAIVREDDKLTFYVVAHAVNSLDSANTYTWTVDVTSIRYTDAEGAILTEGSTSMVAANTGVNVVKLSSSSDVKVKVSLDSSNPAAGTVKVSDDSSGDLVTLLTFRVKAEGTDIDFDQLQFTIATGTGSTAAQMVSEYRLMRGSTVVETADNSNVSAGVLTISLDDSEMVDQDETVTYSLVAKMNKNTFVGSSMKASLASNPTSLNANDSNGDALASGRFSGGAVGEFQTFRADGLFVDAKTVTATLLSTGGNNSKQYGQFKFVMDVTADGDDFYFGSTSASFTYNVLNGVGTAIPVGSSTATVSSDATKTAAGDYVIYDGQTKSVTFIVTMKSDAVADAYKAVVATMVYGVSAAITGETANLAPASDFTSDPVTIVQ